MEELAAAPPSRQRERRHRRKASDAAAAARAAYGDVFGGPPRFAPPFAGVPGDYADVFGGVAASCSIPYLDLPSAAAAARDDGAGAYGEIFGRFEFGDFAPPYEDVFAEADGMAEEFASWSGSSRSSVRKESGQLDVDPSILYQHYQNVGYSQQFDAEQFSPISFPPDGEQQFSMSYNKATRGRPDDLVEMTTCMVEPSISYVVNSCNSSNDSTTNHVRIMDNDTLSNGEKEKVSPPFPASSRVKSGNSDSVADQKQDIPTCLPISEIFYEDEDYQKRSSIHSASSEEAPCPDYPFLRVSNISLQTPPIKVQPPSMTPSKLLSKKESKANGDSEVNPNSAAAAAIKEAMEFAEARLKAAKELMERKGDSFKLRKRPGHHRGTKSTEIKEKKTLEEVHRFEEKLTLRRPPKEENNYEGLALLDKNTNSGAVKLAHHYHDGEGVLPPGKPQQMMQSGSELEQFGKWASGAEFYELISHDQKCRANPAACEGDNVWTTNLFTKSGQSDKGKGGVIAGDLERDGKLWDGNGITELKMKQINLREDDAASMEVQHKVHVAPEVSLCEERAGYQEPSDSHIKEHVGASNSPKGHDDDGICEISCINGVPPKLHVVPEISSFPLEVCISEGHAKSCSGVTIEETPLVGKSNKDNGNKKGPAIPFADNTRCTLVRSHILQEHPEVPNMDEIETTQAEVPKSEESTESYETGYFQTMSSTVHREAETYEKDKLFNFVDEACLQNENERVTEVPPEALIREEAKIFGTEEKAGLHEDFQEGDVDWDVGSPEKEANVTLVSYSANENEEAEELNAFEGDSKLMENNVRSCGTSDEDSDQLQESHGSLEPQNLENRMDGVEEVVSHGNEKEAKEYLLENSENTLVEEISNHDSKEGRTSTETGINTGPNDVYAEVNVRNDGEANVFHPGTEVITDDYSDYAMKMSTCSKDLQAFFSEACVSMRHLSQNAESVSAQTYDESTPVIEIVEENCTASEREFSTKKYTTLEEGQKTGSQMEERDVRDRISSAKLKVQQSVHLESDTIPTFAEDTVPNFVQKSREEAPNVQTVEGRYTARKTEREIEKEEVFRRLDEEKERECQMEKEKEQSKEKPRRELEEVKERERERAKDRLAVQRATREAHERAFAEARAKAERIALQRITSAQQRASAEAREKEEKASAEAATEKACRESRIKAERAAVERATAEARERAIEKAMAAADAKERMERFRSSFKDSFKATNQGTQFQQKASNNYGRSTDSCNQVVEVESALRHKARSERHQRTAERAAKALAEKNMRDMMAQREQAEKHRLAEFLDPEVKRWSNGKEGNLRALLSTLQYILSSDSGWQSVPLTDLITAAAVKKAYRRATLCVHPDKLQQRGATIRQKYICEKVFDLLKDAWNKFNSEER